MKPMRSYALIVCFFFCAACLAQHPAGLNFQKKGSAQGYVLFAPLFSTTTYLVDKCGKQVHTWSSKYRPGQSVYFLPDGTLLRTGNDSNEVFKGGGILERFSWNSKLLWSYAISSATACQHHDIYPMPNGNILVLVWELKTREEALKAGRNPALLKDGLWSEKIVELKPLGKNGAKIVWEWSAWDHLVQEHDSLRANFAPVSKNRQLIHLNHSKTDDPDFLHFNSIAYNAELDQILISNRNYSEIFILDHSTTSQQAASHSGGKYNKGGDLLFRFGNSNTYNGRGAGLQTLYGQHSAHWIEKGLKDEGKILLFNNGMGRRENNYSSIDLVTQPVDDQGNYGPVESAGYKQIYSEKQNEDLGGNFFSLNVSSAQRLANGNTLVCSGSTGQFCEITPDNQVVWLYVNPVTLKGIVRKGTLPNLNQVFRCTFFEPGFKGFKGKKLEPGLPIEPAPDYKCFFTERPEE